MLMPCLVQNDKDMKDCVAPESSKTIHNHHASILQTPRIYVLEVHGSAATESSTWKCRFERARLVGPAKILSAEPCPLCHTVTLLHVFKYTFLLPLPFCLSFSMLLGKTSKRLTRSGVCKTPAEGGYEGPMKKKHFP
jgi:hypothetical protein